MKFFEKINSAIDKGLTKAIFDHVRNYLMCAFLFAAGSYGMQNQSELFLSEYIGPSTGIALFILAGLLALLNFYDGVYKLTQLKYHNLISVLLFCIYILLSFRIVEITLGYRIGV